jgi:hypothetical protein
MTVSLPSSWVKHYNLKKGEEIDVLEEDNYLMVRPLSFNSGIKTTELSFAGLDRDTRRDLILTTHRKGYDEIKINFDNQSTVKELHEFLNTMQLGFEVIKQEQNSVLLRNISNPESEQFEDLFRRTFRITLEYSKKIESIMRNKEDITHSCLLHETSINRISNYCKRIIIKEKQQNACFLYAIMESLTGVSHNLTAILNETKNTDLEIPDAFSARYAQLTDILLRTYELYYKFSIKDYNLVKMDLVRLKKQIGLMKPSDAPNPSSQEYLNLYQGQISNLLSTTLAIRL